MNTAVWIALFLPLVVLWIRRRRRIACLAVNMQRKKKGGKTEMLELARRFVGKDCFLYTVTDNTLKGVIREIQGNALLIETKNTVEAVNLDYIVRISEDSRKKK